MQFIPRNLKSYRPVGSLNQPATANELKAMQLMDYRCQCCDFVAIPTKECATAGLEFVDINGKLHLLCIMCAQSQLLSRPMENQTGSPFNHGKLVYCPEVSQGQLISIIRDIYALQVHASTDDTRRLGQFTEELRQNYITNLMENCTSIPNLNIINNDLIGYSNLYRYAPDTILVEEEKVFSGVRYIPDEIIFCDAIEYWYETSYKSFLDVLR